MPIFGPYPDHGAPESGTWLAYQYARYRFDSETGLCYMPARYYSPALLGLEMEAPCAEKYG